MNINQLVTKYGKSSAGTTSVVKTGNSVADFASKYGNGQGIKAKVVQPTPTPTVTPPPVQQPNLLQKVKTGISNLFPAQPLISPVTPFVDVNQKLNIDNAQTPTSQVSATVKLGGKLTTPKIITDSQAFIEKAKVEGNKLINESATGKAPEAPGFGIVKGMYKGWQDPTNSYGDQYAPISSDEKIGKIIAQVAMDWHLWGNLKGVFQGAEADAILKGTIETSPIVAKISTKLNSIGKTIETKFNVFTESIKGSKLTLQDAIDVTSGVNSTPEKVAEFKRLQTFAKKNGLDFMKIVKENTDKANQKKTVYNFFKTLKSDIKTAFENVKKAGSGKVTGETKLLAPSREIPVGGTKTMTDEVGNIVVVDDSGQIIQAVDKTGTTINVPPVKTTPPIETSVVQIKDVKTGQVEYKTIPKGELASFDKVIDNTQTGIAGQEINGKIYHLTAKTPEQMDATGAKFIGEAKLTDIPQPPKSVVKEKVSAKEEFRVGDVLDPQGKTNMEGRVTISAIEGNTLKFTDSKGTKYQGMQRSVVRDLIKGGSWKKVTTQGLTPEVNPLIAEAKKIPNILYRGSKTGDVRAGAFYSPIESYAKQFAGESGVVAKVTAEIKKPYITDWMPESELNNLIPKLKKQGYDAVAYKTFEDPNKIMSVVPFNQPINQAHSPEVKGKAKELTLKPSTATKDTIEVEVAKVEAPVDSLKFPKFEATDKGMKKVLEYRKPVIGKTEMETLLTDKKFKANPVLTVNEKKNLEFKSDTSQIEIVPRAMAINPNKLNVGDKIRVDLEALKTGKVQQMRIYKGEEAYGYNPKNLEDPFSPKATKEVQKIIKQSDIAKEFSKKLGVPIRRGKFRHRGAIGLYIPRSKIARYKSGGLPTIFHEAGGHYIDDIYDFSKDIDIKERKALMVEYGFEYKNQPRKQRHEAFAEFIRFRLTGQTVRTVELAPNFSKLFDERIKNLPEIKAIMDTASADYKRWAEQPATAKILSQISIGKQKGEGLVDRATAGLHELYTLALDDIHPLGEFSALARKNLGQIEVSKDPYILARNMRGWVGKADLFLNKGTFEKTFWRTNEKGKREMVFTGKSYSKIMKPLEKAKLLDDFRVYIVAQRVVNDLAPRGIRSGITLKDAQTSLEELGTAHPEFEKIAEERRVYRDALLKYASQNGLVGKEGLARIKELNKFHVPFYRVMEESQTKFMGKSKFAGNMGSPIRKIKGSDREIIDPFESDIKDTYALINAAERNNIGVAMANIASKNFELARLFEQVDRPMKPTTVNVAEVLNKALEGTGLTTKDIPEDLGEEVVTLFRPTQDRGANMLNVNLGDTQAVFQVEPSLFRAIQGLNAEDTGMLMKILSFPAKLLRIGATLSPDFSVRNPFRDQFTAFVYSKYNFIPGVDLIKGVFELFKGGDTYNLWKAAGGEHSMMVSMDRENLQKGFKEIMRSKGATALDYVKNPLKFLRIISELGEVGTRLGEMRLALQKVDPLEAAFASREITLDFARIGAKTKAMNMITAFWNANVQGTDKMIRSFKANPFRTLFRTLLGITLPSILLYLAQKDDPRWKEIPAWQKDLFWIILTPEHIYRIPKPFELGILFGSVPERVMEVIDTKNPLAFEQLEKSIAGGFTPGFIPTALLPIIENITNYSFFLDRPIISQGQANLPPAEQAGTYTSELSRVIGETLNYSPAKVDNLISGYSGGLGKYGVSIIDKVLLGTGITQTPPPPAKSLEDTPVLKAFMIRNPVGSSSESVNQIYTLYGRYNPLLSQVKKLITAGEMDKAQDYLKKHPEAVKAIPLTTLVTNFSSINKVVDEIRGSKTISPQDKKDKIQKLDELKTKMARDVLDELKKTKWPE